MPEVVVINSEGAEIGKITLSPKVFEEEPRPSLIHSAVVAHLANRRAGSADTKTRDEVRGGGRKPWRQKGTGRARIGSIRAPHWTGGGVVFGPHPRDYSIQMPKKMRRLALRSALSSKLADGQLIVSDEIKMDAISTKQMVEILNKMGAHGKTMLVISEPDEIILKSIRNIPWAMLVVAPSLSTFDILNAETVIIIKDAVAKIEEVQAR